MFAIVETGSKQYMVKVGDVIMVEKLSGDVGSMIELDKIIMSDYGITEDTAKKIKITAEILEHKKTKKVIVFKKKRRHNYRRKNGHRQNITVLKINKIA